MSKKKSNIEAKKERVLLAEIYKENGQLGITYPNPKDVMSFEIYGFLKILVENMELDLLQSLERES